MSGDTLDSDGNALNLVTKWTTTTETVVDVEAYLMHQPTSKVGTTRDDLVEQQMSKLNLKRTLKLNKFYFNSLFKSVLFPTVIIYFITVGFVFPQDCKLDFEGYIIDSTRTFH